VIRGCNRPSVAIVGSIFALALAARLAFLLVPALERLVPLPYYRALDFADAARNVLEGRGAVIDRQWVQRGIDQWQESGRRLPPEPSAIPRSEAPELVPFYDEIGYLVLTIAFGWLVGDIHWLPPILLQCALSAGIAALLCICVTESFASRAAGLLVGLTYALHPLEIALAIGPDLPVWGIYAGSVCVCLVLTPAKMRGLLPLLLRFSAGAFVGFCIAQRGPNAAVLAAASVALLALRRFREAGWILAGAVALLCAFSALPLRVPSVGRSAMHHTLLAGLAEFGDIEGLEWKDASLHTYLQERYGVEPLTPEFDAAAKQELQKVLRERPWLPLRVAAHRLLEFTFAWRPARRALVLVAGFDLFKLAVVAGAIWAYLWCRKIGRAGLLLWTVVIVIAPVLLHGLIVPLLEVYIASTLVLLTPFAALGTIAIAQQLRHSVSRS